MPDQVVPNVYRISLGVVNAFMLDDEGALTLIDTGVPGSAGKITAALAELGKGPDAVKHILVTHLHADHTGSLAALKATTHAPVYMHPLDAALVGKGIAARPAKPAPGLLPRLMMTMMTLRGTPRIEPVQTDHEVSDGQELPIANGIKVIHAPGHSAGQVAFLWPKQGGVLFAGDAAANMGNRLGEGIVAEDWAILRQSLKKLAALSFGAACFGHGTPITSGASDQFRKMWA